MEYTFYAKGIGDEILADYEGQVEFDETKMPVFDADNDDFTLTLYNLNYGTNYATQVNENVIEISEENEAVNARVF